MTRPMEVNEGPEKLEDRSVSTSGDETLVVVGRVVGRSSRRKRNNSGGGMVTHSG